MKKITAIAMIMLLSASAQAANLNWGTGVAPTSSKAMESDGTTPLAVGSGWAMLLNFSTAADMTAFTGLTGSEGAWALSSGSVLQTQNVGYNRSSAGVNSAITAANAPGRFQSVMLGQSNPTAYYAIVFFTDGAGVGATSPSLTAYQTLNTGTYAYKTFTVSGLNAGNQTIALGAANTTWSATTAVPEPTAMALLAIGVAAVGLRRKFLN